MLVETERETSSETSEPGHAASRSAELREIIGGLRSDRKWISPKFFYDKRGSELFERITQLNEYYVARAETALLRRAAPEIAEAVGSGKTLVEFGSGASRKTRYILDAAQDLKSYVPIDICGEFIEEVATGLREDYPRLEITPVCADFTKLDRLPSGARASGVESGLVGFFPGSTLGNFDPAAAVAFLRNANRLLGAGGKLILGVDPFKEARLHELAYNDAEGVTRDFNLNVLRRLNEEHGADFDLASFRHLAYFNPDESRVEMHLVSLRAQTVRIGGQRIAFRADETIHTENSYKFTEEMLVTLFERSGFGSLRSWKAPGDLFAIHLVEARPGGSSRIAA